jgi:glycosyltransferase involved in cell wall biosynthesis
MLLKQLALQRHFLITRGISQSNAGRAAANFQLHQSVMHSSEAPLVSIVIPCYNQERYVAEAISSALAQTFRNIEVVVVDDGSADTSASIAESYGVRCIRQSNRGVAEACNAGLRASRGEFIMFLGADDRLKPTAAEAHLLCFAQNPGAGFVVGDIDHIDAEGSYIGSPRWPILDGNQYEELLKVNHVANTIAVMFRRTVFETAGEFDASCMAGEDYEMLLRAARTFSGAHHGSVVTEYRRHQGGMTQNGIFMLRSMQRVMESQKRWTRGDHRLETARKTGVAYWRNYYGAVALKQVYGELLHGRFIGAARVLLALLTRLHWHLLRLLWRRRARFRSAAINVPSMFEQNRRDARTAECAEP